MLVDTSWSTSLGVSFYDREEELSELEKLLRVDGTLLILGPRNVGKSELIKYFVSRRASEEFVVIAIDARDVVTKKLAGSVVGPSLAGVAKKVLSKLEEMLRASYPPALAIISVVDEIVSAAKRWRKKAILFIDEYHFLHEESLEAAVNQLEALAKMIAFYPEYEYVKLIICDSEGWLTTEHVLSKLRGYAVQQLYVDPLPREVMEALFEEYSRKHGFPLSFKTTYRLIGGAPGFLKDLEGYATTYGLSSWLQRIAGDLDYALSKARNKLKLTAQEVLEISRSVMGATLKPLEDPDKVAVAELLSRFNIAYIKRVGGAMEVHPQLPVYVELLDIALEKGYLSTLDAARDLERALEES